MGTVDFTTERTFDRRIGQRLELDGIDMINVSWIVARAGRFGRRKPPRELPGRIESVSITGAAIAGPSELALSPGDEAVVRCGGRDNIVSIRHCEPTADDHTVRYGVEITRVQPTLTQRIRELLDPTLARMPVEVAPPGRLSLRGDVARPAAAAASDEGPAVAPTPEPLVAESPDPTDAPAAPDDHIVLDLTDATMAANGGSPVLDLTEPEPVIAPEATIEPEPVVDAGSPIEPAPAAEATAIDPHVPMAQPAHLPPVETSEGRRVLDEVFGLMED